jgi:hypothetical protein
LDDLNDYSAPNDHVCRKLDLIATARHALTQTIPAAGALLAEHGPVGRLEVDQLLLP